MEEIQDPKTKMILLEAKVGAMHSRLDKVEIEMKNQLGEIAKDVKSLIAFENRSKGWGAALLFFGGIIGAAIVKLFIK
jgi:translation elongation factor EF-G